MKIDARTRYSKKVIQDVFYELLKEKELQRITVKEVCEQAEINRSTFYKYYKDCYDLLDCMIADALADFDAKLAQSKKVDDKDMIKQILDQVKEYAPLFGNASDRYVEQHFIEQVNLHAIEYMSQTLLVPNKTQIDNYLAYIFILGGENGLVTYWIKSGMKESTDEMAENILKLHNLVLAHV